MINGGAFCGDVDDVVDECGVVQLDAGDDGVLFSQQASGGGVLSSQRGPDDGAPFSQQVADGGDEQPSRPGEESDEQSSQQVFQGRSKHHALENEQCSPGQSRKSTLRKKFYISFSDSFIINSALCRKILLSPCTQARTTPVGITHQLVCRARIAIISTN